jgi:lipopolysaccharide/colanic/teichoic acid biosynthesis glycosyltransferase
MPAARRETLILTIGDVLLMGISLWLALLLRNFEAPSWAYYNEHLHGFVFVFAISLLIFYISGLYERRTRLVKRILGVRILGGQVANTAIAAILFFVLPFAVAPKTVLAIYLLISVVLLSTWRFFGVPMLSLASAERALMIGEGEAVDEVLQLVRGNKKYYVEFVGQVKPSQLLSGTLADAIKEHIAQGIRLIVIDSRDPLLKNELPQLYDAILDGCIITEFSTFYEGLLDRVPGGHIDHAWLLEHLPRTNITYALAKRTIDILGALLGSVLALPFIAFGVISIYLSGGRDPFIRHERVGRGNTVFHIIKLRTMLLNDHGDPELQKQNRVTRVGYVLRKTRIDELPQLWNILAGHLSFIGPRPELPSLARIYQKEIPYYDVRHLITPGLSGWAQIYDYDAPRGGADLERTRRKLAYDLYYLKHRSFGLDMAIALKTLRALLSFSGT